MDHPGLLRLLAEIHDTVTEPAAWQGVLESISDATGGSVAALQVFWPQKQLVRRLAATRFDPVMGAEYDARWAHVNPWFVHGASRITPGLISTGEEAVGNDVLVRTDFFENFLRPMGVFHALNSALVVSAQESANLSLVRSRRAGPYDTPERRLMERLVPHLAGAFRTARLLEGVEAQGGALLEAVEGGRLGVMVLDGRGRVRSANRVAREGLRLRQVLSQDREGALCALAPEVNRRLAGLIASSAKTAAGQEGGPGGCLRLSGVDGVGVDARVSPVRGSDPADPSVLVLTRVTTPPPAPEPALLARRHGLTPSEARIASLLAGGLDLAGICETLGIRPNTGRTHLKRVFSKTGTDRQAALVRLLLSSGGPGAFTEMGDDLEAGPG